MPSPAETNALLTPALWGFVGIATTKLIEFLISRNKDVAGDNAEFRKDLRAVLQEERDDRRKRETELLAEIRGLAKELHDARIELETARLETIKAHKTNLRLEKRIITLEVALENAGIGIDTSELDQEDEDEY
jgi:uncharacterized protein YlxW (UPF0749 family)